MKLLIIFSILLLVVILLIVSLYYLTKENYGSYQTLQTMDSFPGKMYQPTRPIVEDDTPENKYSSHRYRQRRRVNYIGAN